MRWTREPLLNSSVEARRLSEDFSDAAGVDQAPVRAANRRLIRRAAFERRVEFKTGISETRARRVQTLDQRVRA